MRQPGKLQLLPPVPPSPRSPSSTRTQCHLGPALAHPLPPRAGARAALAFASDLLLPKESTFRNLLRFLYT